MKKILILIAFTLLLAGCVESMALLGPTSGGLTNSKLVQASAKSAVSYGVKKTTGKSPLRHALTYAEENNPTRKKEKCISFIEKTNSEACAIAKKKVKLAHNKVKDAVAEKAINFKKQFAKARKEGKDSFIFNNKIYNTSFKNNSSEKKLNIKKTVSKFTVTTQTSINEKNKIKYLD
jgi:hypothetical protein